MKLGTFFKTTPFYKKNYGPPPYKKLQPLISAFIKNSIFGNNRDPCSPHSRHQCTLIAETLVIIPVVTAMGKGAIVHNPKWSGCRR